jgi:hypothetical protein
MTKNRIKDKQAIQQFVNFDGLNWGKIYPSDVDGIIDFNRGGLFIIIEFKQFNAKLPLGQRLLYQNLCNAISDGGRLCYVIVAEHSATTGHDIPAKDCRVREYYHLSQWHHPRSVTTTLIDAINSLLTYHNIKLKQ